MYNDIIFRTPDQILSLPWEKNPRPLRDRGGVYTLRLKGSGDLAYVGQTANLGGRLREKSHPVFRKALHDAYILFTDNRTERRYVEARCIEILNPPENRRRGLRTDYSPELERAYYNMVFG